MLNEDSLRDILIAMAMARKSSVQNFVSLLIEVAALRDTVRALDPTFSETFENRKRANENRVVLEFSPLIEMCDEIIRKLEAGEVC